ncbi:MAG TPA: hypothetical protein DCW68_03955 [Rhodospirillaceae bacterium]|nr:MAG: hypothetical protein A2018_07140 [Alphaproteobacteria bacterium GWF2_58_20]HAU29249.1 hypothetical protein [Rhodospirillaceae bacterium]
MQDTQYEGNNIHTRQERLNQAFRRAAKSGNTTRMEKLYHGGAVPFAKNVAGISAYDLALENNREDALAFMDGIMTGQVSRKKPVAKGYEHRLNLNGPFV